MKPIHLLPPEAAHGLGIWALKHGLLPAAPLTPHPSLAMELFGLRFPHPIGLAAGFDKNAEATDALLGQGFGFVEAGTATPRPQPGNPRPRLFRLAKDEAVINRLGFNNGGLAAFAANLQRRDRRLGIVGANIGRNKDTADAVSDYVEGLELVYPHADYVTVNISSPNTEGLRALQEREALEPLLAALARTRENGMRDHGRRMPLLLKVAPDLKEDQKRGIVEAALAHGVDGLIVGNTTISRPPLESRYRSEQGGLSGRPLFALSTGALKDFYRLSDGKIPLIGVGGISSAEDAYAKIRAGASLVQLYTALVYRGFKVVREIQNGLAELLARDGLTQVQNAAGADVK